jgi:hypothetical protein
VEIANCVSSQLNRDIPVVPLVTAAVDVKDVLGVSVVEGAVVADPTLYRD